MPVERQLVQAKAQELLRLRLKRRIEICGYVGYLVVDPDGRVLAADQDAPVGRTLTGSRKEVFDQALAGKTAVCQPFRSILLLADEKGELRANLPTMFAIAPLRDEAGKPIAALGARIRPENQFTRILQVVRFGKPAKRTPLTRTGFC